MNTIDFILENKIISVTRKTYGDDLLNFAKALYEGGIKMMEITFDQSNPDSLNKTSAAIELLSNAFKDKMCIGAGTVLNVEQVEAAYKTGAKYIVSPSTNVDVIKKTKELGLLSMSGAMTPSEIMIAHDAGADIVKLFPCGFLGLTYIKDIKGPINHVKLLGTGGISEDNFKDFLNAGLVGVGIGSYLCDRKLIEAKDWSEITRRAKVFTSK